MHEDNYRRYYSIACCDIYASMVKRMAVGSVSEVLCVGYKNIFLRDLLEVSNQDFYTDVLINTMCLFDSKQDKIFVSKMIDITQPIFLDGYYHFKMQDIKEKWKDICKLVEENYFIVGDTELTLEFLQYLLQSIDNRCKCLSILMEKDAFYLFGTDNKAIRPVHCIAKNNVIEQDAMQNILYLNPQKVVVYCKQRPSDEFVYMTEKLFDSSFVVKEQTKLLDKSKNE